jgi:hypothetical protein
MSSVSISHHLTSEGSITQRERAGGTALTEVYNPWRRTVRGVKVKITLGDSTSALKGFLNTHPELLMQCCKARQEGCVIVKV